MILTGCGFQPMLKNNANGKQPFILTVKGDGYAAYVFRREIEKQLAMIPFLSEENYDIRVNVKGSQMAATIAQDATVSRVNLTYVADYKIVGKNWESISQSSSITSSYPVFPEGEFVSKNADFSATTRIMSALAQEVALEIVRDLKQEIDRQPKI